MLSVSKFLRSPPPVLSRFASTFKPERWEEIYTAQAIDPSEKTFDKILIANRGEIACRYGCKGFLVGKRMK